MNLPSVANKIILKKILSLVFTFYLITLIWVSFISLGHTERNTYFNKKEIHIVPFKNTYTSLKSLYYNTDHLTTNQVPYYWFLFIRNIAGNIVLLVPWGFLIPILFRKVYMVKTIFILTLLLSSLIETVQYIFTLGVCDIDDVIYNIAGALLGFYLFKFIHRTRDLKN